MVLGIEPRALHILGKHYPLSDTPASPSFVFETGSQHVVQAGLELTEVHLALPSECWD